MARRVHELPETQTAFTAGELSEDQVAVIAHRALESIDAEVAELVRRVSCSYAEQDTWRLSAELPADEGAAWERALTEAREELFRAGEAGPGPGASPAAVSWADALVAMPRSRWLRMRSTTRTATGTWSCSTSPVNGATCTGALA